MNQEQLNKIITSLNLASYDQRQEKKMLPIGDPNRIKEVDWPSPPRKDGGDRDVKGICTDYCPRDEVIEREQNKRLHKFEIKEGTENDEIPRADPKKIVKEFSRPAAGKTTLDTKELRTPRTLLDATNYLITKVLNRKDVSYSEVYEYVFDRLRAIRQDLIIQRILCLESVKILERCVRFHIYSMYRLCEEKASLNFDPHINKTHLRESLQLLLYQYDQLYDQDPKMKLASRLEFEAIYILYHLDCRNDDALVRYKFLPQSIQHEGLVYTAYRLTFNYRFGNYYSILAYMRSIQHPSIALIVHMHIPSLHSLLIRNFAYGYSSQQLIFPLKALCTFLCPYEDDQDFALNYCRDIVEYFGFPLVDEDMSVKFVKTLYNNNASSVPNRLWPTVEARLRSLSPSDWVFGKTWEDSSNQSTDALTSKLSALSVSNTRK